VITEAYIDGLKIHDTTTGLPTYPFALSGAEGLLDTGVPREDRPQKARRHGLYELTSYYDGRPITLDGRCVETSHTNLWSSLDLLKQRFALSGLVHTLKWRRYGEAFLMRADVTVNSKIEIVMKPGFISPRAEWHVDLIAADPRMYKDALDTVTFSSAGNASNDGNFNSPPVITFNTPGVNPGLRNDELSAENEIKFTYGGGGTALVVDVKEREITLDGTSRPDLINPLANDFWSLVSGINHLTKTGGATSVTVEWRDAWN
jgi:hypothetical protein